MFPHLDHREVKLRGSQGIVQAHPAHREEKWALVFHQLPFLCTIPGHRIQQGPPLRLTFLILEPELLLDLLAGKMDDAGELGAIQSLCDVVGAVVLDEGQQLVPTALFGQDL